MKYSNKIEIKATPEEVFYWIGDPTRAMQWMTSVTRTEFIEETPDLVGSTFREYVEEDGRGTEMHGVVLEFVENERMAFYLEGDYNTVEVIFTLESKGEGTLLTQTADVQFKGMARVMSILLRPLFTRQIRAQAQKEFVKLKELCE